MNVWDLKASPPKFFEKSQRSPRKIFGRVRGAGANQQDGMTVLDGAGGAERSVGSEASSGAGIFGVALPQARKVEEAVNNGA